MDFFLEAISGIEGTLLGAIVGFTITLYTTSYGVIKKKTKAEAIQKLKIDNMIKIINGVEEFRRAFAITHNYISAMSVAINLGYSSREIPDDTPLTYIANLIRQGIEPCDIRVCILFDFQKTVDTSVDKFQTFISLLEKDKIINGTCPVLETKINELKTIGKQMSQEFFELGEPNIINHNDIKNMSTKMVNNLTTNKPAKTINEPIAYILKIYKERLAKEQEDWRDKLINFFKRDVKKD